MDKSNKIQLVLYS